MKSVLKIFVLFLFPVLAAAQDEKNYEDSLLSALKNAANDTIRMDINRKLGFYHQDSDRDTALVYHQVQLALAEKLKLKLWEADASQQIAYCYSNKFRLSEAYENYMKALRIAEDPASAANGWGYSNFSYSKNPDEARQSIMGIIHFELAGFYSRTRDKKNKAFSHLSTAIEIGERLNNRKILSLASREMGVYYLNLNKTDSAFVYFQKALLYYKNSPYQKNLGYVYLHLSRYYIIKGNYDSAKYHLHNAIYENAANASTLIGMGVAQRSLGAVFIETSQLDSALVYTLLGQKIAYSVNDLPGKVVSFLQLGTIYKLKKEYSIAYDYLEKGKNLADSLNNNYVERLMQFLNLDFDQKVRLQELEKEQQLTKSRNRMFVMLTGLGIFLIVAMLLYRNNRQKQKANAVLETTLNNLKSTQSQLIQSEKMASLGELTAGIAHEIQNPLNFVNNFSEVNKELLAEMKAEMVKGNMADATEIANDVMANEDKIHHHGKRADAIVKGMLQHSQSSSGIKELTDINAIAEEYLRLAYHGLRAKDKSFNASLKTEYDHSIGKINIISQDIGRVLLNMYNNAFFAVTEKQKSAVEGYDPTVSVSTKKVNGELEITVADNGNGIPEKVLDKVFQPFFTTKPTGQGTGLGLSLSYDIIKAHQGKINIRNRPGAGAEFIITLPINA